jgi:hypothetical protein
MDPTQFDPSLKPRSSTRKWIVGCLLGGLLLLGAISFPLWGAWLIWPPRLSEADRLNRTEIERRGDRYTAIVGRIAKHPLRGQGLPTYFEISEDRDPSTLNAFDRAGSEDGYEKLHKQGRLIVAWHEPGDRLTAQFVTKDFGHMGLYCLVYTDRPVGFTPMYCSLGDKVTQIAPNWWAVYCPHR